MDKHGIISIIVLVIKYCVGAVVLARMVVSIVFAYQYVSFSTTRETTKGGTFVEAITEPISYLPYWGDHELNKFYQTLLFPGCLGGLDGDVCSITSSDNQVYQLTLHPDKQRSDGVRVSLDDIVFSYQDIVVSNLWEQPYLSKYQDIVISQGENDPDTLLFTFPTQSSDNRAFFEFPILPAHIVGTLSLDDYVSRFANHPTTLGCVQLATSKDPDSIIFNLSNCQESSLNYYQIKSFTTPEQLQKAINKSNSLVSFYHGIQESDYYTLLGLKDNNYTTLFFNSESTRISPRIQRALAGFIQYDFWNEHVDHSAYIVPYQGLFDLYVSTGANLANYIQEKNPSLSYDNVMLEQGGVYILPPRFTIDWAQRKYAFYLNATDEKTISFTIETPDPVTAISAVSNNSARHLDVESKNNNTQHRLTFTLGAGQQIQEGLNSITIMGTVLGKKQTIASIDLYFLGKTSDDSPEVNKIRIVTLNNLISNYIRVQLQNIFEDHGLQVFFEFEIYDTMEEFLNALKSGNYEVALTSMQIRGLYDVYHILNSGDPTINPSRLQDAVLNQFLLDGNRTQSRNMIADKMPFTIIGQLLKPYWIQDTIDFTLNDDVSEQTIRNDIVRNIHLVSHSSLRMRDLFDIHNVRNFLSHISYNKLGFSLQGTGDSDFNSDTGDSLLFEQGDGGSGTIVFTHSNDMVSGSRDQGQSGTLLGE